MGESMVQWYDTVVRYGYLAGGFALEIVLALLLAAGYVNLSLNKMRGHALGKNKRKKESEFDHISLIEENQEPEFVLSCHEMYPVAVSKKFYEIFGIDEEQFQDDVECFLGVLQGRTGKDIWKEYKNWDGNGSYRREVCLETNLRWYQMCVTRSEDKTYDDFRFYDITEEKERLEELENRLKEAENESQSKTVFLSNMSHEIRTPMNGIIGMLTLAHSQLHEHKAEQYIEKAEQLSQYLLSVINDILDMSRIEAGKIQLEKSPFSLERLAEKLRNMFQKNVESKGIAFSVELKDFDVDYVVGDELRISQVLVNFLSNAVKFTSRGEIRVVFQQLFKENGKISFLVRVHDTGTGMDARFISRIFKPFEQERADTAKNYGGSGLGMAITDQLVRLMGGEIMIDSMPGRGSDFTVYLSLPIADAAAQMDRQPEDAEEGEEFSYAGTHILMAEDNEVNAEIAVSILEMKGARVTAVENGQEAVEAFAQAAPGTYDLILMDIQMPVMDGREATRRIRALDREDAKNILILALSADAFVEDQRLSVECGMNGHIAKPIDFEAMRKVIGRARREQRKA